MPLSTIDRTLGTNIGDLTDDGGLAAAFDGDTSQGTTACAAKAASSGYVGKTLAARARFGRATIYGGDGTGSATGFVSGSNPSVTINIRGKQGSAPSSRTDGTLIGTTTFTDTSDESGGRTINSSDTITEWDHLWAEVVAASGSGLRVAELVLERFFPANAFVLTLI